MLWHYPEIYSLPWHLYSIAFTVPLGTQKKKTAQLDFISCINYLLWNDIDDDGCDEENYCRNTLNPMGKQGTLPGSLFAVSVMYREYIYGIYGILTLGVSVCKRVSCFIQKHARTERFYKLDKALGILNGNDVMNSINIWCVLRIVDVLFCFVFSHLPGYINTHIHLSPKCESSKYTTVFLIFTLRDILLNILLKQQILIQLLAST